MKHCCQNCPNCDPWERKLPGGYNDEEWPSGDPISEEEQKKLLVFAEALGRNAGNAFRKVMRKKNFTVNLIMEDYKKEVEKALHEEVEKENRNSKSKYSQSISFTRKDLFGGNDK